MGNTLRSISLPSGKWWHLLKRNRSTPQPLEGMCWGNGFYHNVLSQGRLFSHHCPQIFSFLQHNTFSILVLSQSRLLSHCSQACKFFPNTQQFNIYIHIYIYIYIYIYSKLNSRFLANVSSISLEQYLVDVVYHHLHTSTLPKVGLMPPWSTNAM